MTYFDGKTIIFIFFFNRMGFDIDLWRCVLMPGPMQWLYTYFSSVIILVFLNS